MKKLWLTVLALLLVTPSFALNSEIPTEKKLLDALVQEVGDFGESFPLELQKAHAKIALAFLANPTLIVPDEISAMMLDIWLAEECLKEYKIRNSQKLRQEYLENVVPGKEIDTEEIIFNQAKWYNEDVMRIQGRDEEDVKEQKRNIILRKLQDQGETEPSMWDSLRKN